MMELVDAPCAVPELFAIYKLPAPSTATAAGLVTPDAFTGASWLLPAGSS